MGLFCGIDLHSNNGYYGVIDDAGKKIRMKKLPNILEKVLEFLSPYKTELIGVVVESTYNWYWLVDGLQENGYKVRLANPAGIDQYSGLKHADDKSDAFFLAELLRLGILKEGYIYPKEERPVRDLLRRRLGLVRQRTSQILSFQSLMTRQMGGSIKSNRIKTMEEEDVGELFDDSFLAMAGRSNISIIRFLTQKIKDMEKAILRKAQLKPGFENLLTVPGVGTILAMTISLETGDIGRFQGSGNFASYCRCVKSSRTSNEKKKGENNRKNGNKYLAWAFVEAANHCIQFCEEAKAYFQRKMSRTNRVVATKALASKMAKACYFMMRDGVPFKKERIFVIS